MGQAQDTKFDYSDYLQFLPDREGRWEIDLDAPPSSMQHPDYHYNRSTWTMESIEDSISKGAPPVTAARLRQYEELGGDIEDIVDQIPDSHTSDD